MYLLVHRFRGALITRAASPPERRLRRRGRPAHAASGFHTVSRRRWRVARRGRGHDLSLMSWPRLVLALAPRALVNPALAVDLLRVGWRFRRRHWWRRTPFLPIKGE